MSSAMRLMRTTCTATRRVFGLLLLLAALASQVMGQAELLPQSSSASSGASSGALSSASELTVAQWRVQLTEGDIDARRSAAKATLAAEREMQMQLLPTIIELLEQEKDGQIRLALFDTVTELGPQAAEAVPALVNAVRKNFGGNYNEELHQDYRAALALASVGAEAVDGLRELLSEEKESRRAEAAMALGRIGAAAQAAIPDLIERLGDESDRVRRDVIVALGAIGEPVVQPLMATSQANGDAPVSARIRAAALEAIGHAAPALQDVADLVEQSLSDSEAEVRVAATELLGVVEMSTTMRRNALLRQLQDETDEVRSAASNAFLQHPAILRDAFPELVELLVAEDDDVAWKAAYLLQTQGGESVPALLQAAEDERSRLDQLAKALALVETPLELTLCEVLRGSDTRGQQVAALALGFRRPLLPDTSSRLADGLRESEGELQRAFLRAIASLGARATVALPVVRELMGHDDPLIRQQSIGILLQNSAKDQQLVGDMSVFLEDSDPSVQRLAIDALKTLGPLAKSTLPAVTELVGGDETDVRDSALAFIGSHGVAASGSVLHLRQLLAAGGDTDWVVAIISTLGMIGEGAQAATDDLVNQLSHREAEIRQASLQALASLRLDLATMRPHLLQALRDSDERVRSEASSSVRRLGARGGALVADIIPLVSQPQVKEDAERLLDRLERYKPDANTIYVLLKLLDSSETEVQYRAIRFLGLALGDAKEAVPRLQSFLEHEDEKLRKAATEAIEKIADSEES